MVTSVTDGADARTQTFQERRRIADRIFRGALIYNAALTVFWLVVLATGRSPGFFSQYRPSLAGAGQVLIGIFFFYVLWGFIWYGVQASC